MKKIFTAILAIAMLCTLLASCAQEVQYKDDIQVATLVQVGKKQIALSSNLTNASEEFMMFFLNVDAALYSEYAVMTPLGSTSIDEFGIFKANNAEDAAKIETALATYLASRKSTWDTRYDQSQKVKVDNAKTAIYGNYVVYTILSPEEQDAFADAIKEMLTK